MSSCGCISSTGDNRVISLGDSDLSGAARLILGLVGPRDSARPLVSATGPKSKVPEFLADEVSFFLAGETLVTTAEILGKAVTGPMAAGGLNAAEADDIALHVTRLVGGRIVRCLFFTVGS